MGIPGTLKGIFWQLNSLSPFYKWTITFAIITLIAVSFVAGLCVSSKPYLDRYPVEYSWWVDHERLHYPGVMISTAMVNTSCRQTGNIHPPKGDNITQIQWLGGWDGGFVGNLKVVYTGGEVVVPTPDIGECVYLYDVPRTVTVFGQDAATGRWIQLGKRE